MRRPHVYERSAPRAAVVLGVQGPLGRPSLAGAALPVSRALPRLIDDARLAGAGALTEALEAARAEAERLLSEAGWR